MDSVSPTIGRASPADPGRQDRRFGRSGGRHAVSGANALFRHGSPVPTIQVVHTRTVRTWGTPEPHEHTSHIVVAAARQDRNVAVLCQATSRIAPPATLKTAPPGRPPDGEVVEPRPSRSRRAAELRRCAGADTAARVRAVTSAPVVALLTTCAPRGQDANQIATALAGVGVQVTPTRIGHCIVFARSLLAGQVAQEAEPDGRATQEVAAGHSYIMRTLEPYEHSATVRGAA